MSTSLFETCVAIEDRCTEVLLLIDQSSIAIELGNEALYNALCRSTSILLASHLEGFLKECIRSIILDFNFHVPEFKDMPSAMRWTFCRKIAYFEGTPEKEIIERTKQLMTFFDKNSVPLEFDAFTYKETNNKNPSNSFIESSFDKIGVSKILNLFSTTLPSDIFQNDPAKEYFINRQLKRCRSNIYSFPYKQSPSNIIGLPEQRPTTTIWHTFIEEIMSRRHKIAHGDTTENITTHTKLYGDVKKLRVLLNGLVLSASTALSGR